MRRVQGRPKPAVTRRTRGRTYCWLRRTHSRPTTSLQLPGARTAIPTPTCACADALPTSLSNRHAYFLAGARAAALPTSCLLCTCGACAAALPTSCLLGTCGARAAALPTSCLLSSSGARAAALPTSWHLTTYLSSAHAQPYLLSTCPTLQQLQPCSGENAMMKLSYAHLHACPAIPHPSCDVRNFWGEVWEGS